MLFLNIHQSLKLLFYCRFMELAIACCFGVWLGVEYSASRVGKFVLLINQNKDFTPTVIPGIILILISLGSVFSQVVFWLYLYYNETKNSNNLLSIISALLLSSSITLPIIALVVSLSWVLLVSQLAFVLMFFVLPLEILFSNTEMTSHFKIQNPKITNVIQRVKMYGRSNQIFPINDIELDSVNHA